jgi:hypothetical protein
MVARERMALARVTTMAREKKALARVKTMMMAT